MKNKDQNLTNFHYNSDPDTEESQSVLQISTEYPNYEGTIDSSDTFEKPSLYRFDFNLVDKNLPFVDLAWCNSTIERMEDRLKKMKKGDLNADLKTLYKNDQSTLNRIKNYYNAK